MSSLLPRPSAPRTRLVPYGAGALAGLAGLAAAAVFPARATAQPSLASPKPTITFAGIYRRCARDAKLEDQVEARLAHQGYKVQRLDPQSALAGYCLGGECVRQLAPCRLGNSIYLGGVIEDYPGSEKSGTAGAKEAALRIRLWRYDKRAAQPDQVGYMAGSCTGEDCGNGRKLNDYLAMLAGTLIGRSGLAPVMDELKEREGLPPACAPAPAPEPRKVTRSLEAAIRDDLSNLWLGVYENDGHQPRNEFINFIKTHQSTEHLAGQLGIRGDLSQPTTSMKPWEAANPKIIAEKGRILLNNFAAKLPLIKDVPPSVAIIWLSALNPSRENNGSGALPEKAGASAGPANRDPESKLLEVTVFWPFVQRPESCQKREYSEQHPLLCASLAVEQRAVRLSPVPCYGPRQAQREGKVDVDDGCFERVLQQLKNEQQKLIGELAQQLGATTPLAIAQSPVSPAPPPPPQAAYCAPYNDPVCGPTVAPQAVNHAAGSPVPSQVVAAVTPPPGLGEKLLWASVGVSAGILLGVGIATPAYRPSYKLSELPADGPIPQSLMSVSVGVPDKLLPAVYTALGLHLALTLAAAITTGSRRSGGGSPQAVAPPPERPELPLCVFAAPVQ